MDDRSTVQDDFVKFPFDSWDGLPEAGLVVIATEDVSLLGYLCALSRSPFTVGREEGSDLLLNGDGVSRRHAQFEKRDDGWFVVDRGSRNGTRSGRERIDGAHRLANGDSISIGRTVLSFFDGSRDDTQFRALITSVVMAATHDRDLPFPLAVLGPMVSAQTTPLDRVRLLLDSIEAALRFATAVLLGAVSEPAGAAARVAPLLAAAAARAPWERLAFELAPLVSCGGPVERAARKLSSANIDGAPLLDAMGGLAELRARIGRERGLAPNAHANEEPFLNTFLRLVIDALRPLALCNLVSVARIDGIERSGELRYDLYEHRGPVEHFPVRRHRLPQRLVNDWCYLLVPDAGHPPIPLGPIVRHGACSTCGRKEMAIAEGLAFAAPGARVRVRGVITSHESDAEVPDEAWFDELCKAVAPRMQPSSAPPAPPEPEPPSPRRRSSRPTAEIPQCTVLFVGVNPPGLPEVSLIEEHRAIDLVVNAARHQILVIPKFQVQIDELQQCLRAHAPHVIHFSGHGGPEGEIYLKNGRGEEIALMPADLAALLAKLDRPPRCVVLNACYSAMGADELKPHVDCVVGMVKKIGVEPSITFCRAFYQALVEGRSVADAHEAGCAEIRLEKLPDASVPVLDHRPDVIPAKVRLFRTRTPTLQ